MASLTNLIYILTRKNLKLFITNKSNLILLILMPLLIKLTILYFDYALDQAKKSSYLPFPSENKIKKIPKCQNPDNCVSLGYFIVGEEKEWIHNIMKKLAYKNNLEFNKDIKNILNTKNQTEIIEYTNTHKNQTQIGLIFCTSEWLINFDQYDLRIPCKFEKLDDKLIYYSIYYNMTLGFESPYFFKLNSTFPINEFVVSTKRAIDEAILIEETNNDNFEYEFSTKSFPVIENLFYKNTDFMSTDGCFLFYLSIGFSFLLIISDLIEEKVKGLKLYLTVSGLSTFSYLLAWSIYNFFLAIVFSFLNCIVILWTDAGLVNNVHLLFWFIYFFVCVFVMNVFAIFISSIANNGASGYMYAYGFLLFSFVFQSLLNNPSSMNIFYSGKKVATIFRFFFEFYPGYNFIKIYSDLVFFSGSYFKVDQKMFVKGRKLVFGDIFFNYSKNTMNGNIVFPSIFNSFLLLFRNMMIFYFLTYIFEQTLKSNQGVSFNLRSLFCKKKNEENLKKEILEEEISKHNSVLKEEEKVDEIIEKKLLNKDFKNSIIVNEISKTFSTGSIFKPSKTEALKKIKFQVKKGEILSILGQNGAGKTTLINILTGYLSPDSGEAFILGHSLKKNLGEIRKSISLCPQNDIFWPNLTIIEHLKIFAIIKNFNLEELDMEITRLLKFVDLINKKDTKVKFLSGGMKRRLSIAISSIADPKIILYDEPTNGLDPLKRHSILELLKKLKKDKILILTTHSMEEADELSDRIIIMKNGKVCCIGNSFDLKNEFSDEICFFIVFENKGDIFFFEKVFKEKFGEIEFGEVLDDRIFMQCKKDMFGYVVAMFKFFLDEKNGFAKRIKDWGFNEANLEQVFFNLHKKMDK